MSRSICGMESWARAGRITPLSANVRPLLALAAWLTVGCGGGTITSQSNEGGIDAASDQAGRDVSIPDAGVDAEGFACGEATCGPSQICLYPPCGCVGEIWPALNDAGACPAGLTYDMFAGDCTATGGFASPIDSGACPDGWTYIPIANMCNKPCPLGTPSCVTPDAGSKYEEYNCPADGSPICWGTCA
jgi:hypothetical protein